MVTDSLKDFVIVDVSDLDKIEYCEFLKKKYQLEDVTCIYHADFIYISRFDFAEDFVMQSNSISDAKEQLKNFLSESRTKLGDEIYKTKIDDLINQVACHYRKNHYVIDLFKSVVDGYSLREKNILENFEKQTREKNIRESKLNSVLGDEFTLKVDKLINMVKEVAPNDIIKQKFLAALELVPVEKKEFSKFVSSWSDYLLYQVDSSVEYYKNLFSVHNFRKINDRYTVVLHDSRGNERYASSRTNEINKQNFLIAKSK
jgi:hypothetical protein